MLGSMRERRLFCNCASRFMVRFRQEGMLVDYVLYEAKSMALHVMEVNITHQKVVPLGLPKMSGCVNVY